MNVLFVCSANRLRSPTAEDLFDGRYGISARSAGTDPAASVPLTPELVAWADLIVAMEPAHRERIRRKFKIRPADRDILTLGIPDRYERNAPELIALLEDRADPLLRLRCGADRPESA